jgi:hypothetical protein
MGFKIRLCLFKSKRKNISKKSIRVEQVAMTKVAKVHIKKAIFKISGKLSKIQREYLADLLKLLGNLQNTSKKLKTIPHSCSQLSQRNINAW